MRCQAVIGKGLRKVKELGWFTPCFAALPEYLLMDLCQPRDLPVLRAISEMRGFCQSKNTPFLKHHLQLKTEIQRKVIDVLSKNLNTKGET